MMKVRPSLLLLVPFLAGFTPDIGEAPTGTPGSVATGARSWKTGIAVDPASRESSRTFFRALYQASEGASSGWSGDVQAGNAGQTQASFREATALRVNWFRAMAGVPSDVSFKPEFDHKAQKAALMMAANGQLSHYPDKSWKHYSDDGADGAKNSNLGLSDNGPDAITSYILDPGGNNAPVGHRRWILYPHTRFMGTGDIDKRSNHHASNALWVIDGASSSARPESRDEYVAWPPRGYVPYHVVFARWSFSHPKGDFTKANVLMTRDGAPISAKIEFNANSGAGERSLVWVPQGFAADGWAAMPRPAADTRFDIMISNVLVAGAPRSFNYTVHVYDPAFAGADTVEPAISGASAAKVFAQNPYAFNAVPRADGYRYQEARVAPFAAVEGAETGAAMFTATTSPGYAVVAKGIAASGSASFRLAHSQPTLQALAYNRVLVPSAASKVTFKARVMNATKGQIPKLQGRIDGGGVWRDLWTHPKGEGTANEGSFTSYSASLAAFAGRGVRLRFVYENHGGSFYSTTGAPSSGFYFDDVTVTGAEELTTPVEHDVVGTAFSFVPNASAKYALRVRPRFYGKYFLDWGPVKVVEASGNAPAPPPTTPSPPPIPTTFPAPTPTPTSPVPTPSAWTFPWPVPILTPPGSTAPVPTPPVLPFPDLEAPLPFPDLGTPIALPFPLPK